MLRLTGIPDRWRNDRLIIKNYQFTHRASSWTRDEYRVRRSYFQGWHAIGHEPLYVLSTNALCMIVLKYSFSSLSITPDRSLEAEFIKPTWLRAGTHIREWTRPSTKLSKGSDPHGWMPHVEKASVSEHWFVALRFAGSTLRRGTRWPWRLRKFWPT